MASVIKGSLLLAGALVLAGTGVQASEVVKVNVPFPFLVNRLSMPAGQYLVQRDDLDPSVLLIHGDRGTHAGMFVATVPAAGHDPAGEKPALSFTRVENQYRLSNIWESATEGRTVPGR